MKTDRELMKDLVKQVEMSYYAEGPGVKGRHHLKMNKAYCEVKERAEEVTENHAVTSKKRTKVSVGGIVHGLINEGETEEEAKGRILFEAKQRINEKCDLRAHLGSNLLAFIKDAMPLFHARQDYRDRMVDLEGKIPEDEPVMMFRAQDIHMRRVLEQYANAVEVSGGCDNIVTAVRRHSQRVRDWQNDYPERVKSPDMDSKDVVE